MENFLIHDAIRNLYPNVVTIKDKDCFDENENQIEIDLDLVMVEAERLSNIKEPTLMDIIQQQQDIINNLTQRLETLENK